MNDGAMTKWSLSRVALRASDVPIGGDLVCITYLHELPRVCAECSNKLVEGVHYRGGNSGFNGCEFPRHFRLEQGMASLGQLVRSIVICHLGEGKC